MDIRGATPDDLERLLPLLDDAFIFGRQRTVSLRHRFPAVFRRDNLENLLLCLHGKEILSALAIRRFILRENGEHWRGAMIGAVYTRPEQRGQGLASRLLETAAQRLRADGADFGVLWTTQPGFYARLGWVAADCGMLGEMPLARTLHKNATFPVGGGLPPSFSGRHVRSQNLAAKAAPTGFGGICEIFGLETRNGISGGEVTRLDAENAGEQIEALRTHWLDAATLRALPDGYRALPPPAEKVEAILLGQEKENAAYALAGRAGESVILYEMTGHPDRFPALWRETCRATKRILVNERKDSPAQRWLAANTALSWQDKPLALWLPLSPKVDYSRIARWYIPYFDRI